MSGSQQLLLGGVPAAVPVDSYFYSVTSLLHGDGTNGGQNNTFLDSSSNNFTITRNGNTTQGSFSPFSQTGWSNYFDGSGDYLSISSAVSTFQGIGANNFSYECFVYPLRQTNTYGQALISYGLAGNLGSSTCDLVINASGYFQLAYATGSAATLLSPSLAAINQWSHIAVCRSGSTLSMFVNGIRVATASTSATVGSSGDVVYIGNQWYAVEATRQLQGYISNARVLIGSSAYDATSTTITVPSTPLTAITNTKLLTCQSNRFIDNSTNAFAITRNGDTSVQPFSPFNPTTAYSASSIGGSGYFDGSGDYLTVPDNAAFDFGSGDFTISAWVYPQGAGAIIDQGGGGASSNRSFEIYMSSASSISNAYISSDGNYNASYNLTGTTIPNAWNFIEFTRSSGTIRLFVNGALQSSAAANFAIFNSTATVAIGNTSANTVNPYTGYISDVRVLKGTGSASSTVPTAPLTAITNTSLLCNFTNGAIFDNAAVADYETVGNAQISTSVKKYGTGSLAFDGTGDYLYSPLRQTAALGSGDWTIEFWVYASSLSGTVFLFDQRNTSTQIAPCIYIGGVSNNEIKFFVNGSDRIVSGAISATTWYHVAIAKTGNSTKLFINGTQSGSTYSDTNTYVNNPVYIGSKFDGTSGFPGYIDDLRVTLGICRYAYNFTPPTAAFPNIGGTVTLTADPYYEYTTLLLPGNGTNGAQNNTFLDSSTNAFTITRNGNTTQGTFSPFSQTGWGNYFDGSGDYLQLADSTAWDLTGDYTIEMWLYKTSTTSQTFFMLGAGGSTSILLYQNASNVIIFNTSAAVITASTAAQLNTWNHIALVRSGSGSNNTTLYLNGTSVGQATNTASFTGDAANGVRIGAEYPTGFEFTGYISNLRIVKGTAVYTANFTPPTAALTAITNTQLLTCQSNRFIDNSSNAFAITRNGDVSVQAFSPFNPTASWSAATYGGSGYFDGSGDYLDVANNNTFDTNSTYTFECWFYQPTAGNGMLFNRGGGSANWSTSTGYQFTLVISSGVLYWQWNNAGTPSSGISVTTPAAGAWHHFATGYDGTTTRAWVDGVSIGSSTTGYTMPTTRNIIRIGADQSTPSSFPLTGYISGLRFVKGTDVYGVGNTTITVPTAPPTAITNTSLLCNFTNAGIYDATSKNDLETVGNAQISTTQSKFGGSSMYFDGAGDYLVGPWNPLTDLGAGDFTIEFWMYPTAVGQSSVTYLFYIGTNGNYAPILIGQAASGYGIVLYSSSTGSSWNLASGSSFGTATANAWNHVALTRYGANVRLFLNGAVGTTLNWGTTALLTGSSHKPNIGSATGVANTYYTGYMQDLRVTKGIARYTSNFTPPTTAFLTL